MFRFVRNSLVIRGGLALASISLIALFNIFASVIVADQTQGDAAAINMAGSMRMQAFRIGYQMQKSTSPLNDEVFLAEVETLDRKFDSGALLALRSDSGKPQTKKQFSEILQMWREDIQPALLYSESSAAALRDDYDARVMVFVEKIDQMVGELQRETEGKIQLLLAIQGASMFLTVIVVFVAMANLTTNVVLPLRLLVSAANAVRKGDLSVHVDVEQDDELGQLSKAFNRMARELSSHYHELESRVREKTTELTRSNRSLELVYDATRRLSENQYSASVIETIAEDLRQATNVQAVSVCLEQGSQEKPFAPAISDPSGRPAGCDAGNCNECFTQGARQASFGISPTDPVFPLRFERERFGVMFVTLHPGQRLEHWQVQLFQAVSERIATAFSLARKAEQEGRYMLLEERNTIARELHDSLAQSLSYVKFRIGALQMLQKKLAPAEEQQTVINEIKDAVNNAYGHLRELLTTFRLKINEPGLEQALNGTVAEFSQRGDLDIQLKYGLRYYRLTPNEEIHILQIVREALSNVVRHAQASRALITLEASDGGDVTLMVEDNGIGIQENREKLHHYGLTIMGERARKLGGELHLVQSRLGGVCVHMKCHLALYKPQPVKEIS